MFSILSRLGRKVNEEAEYTERKTLGQGRTNDSRRKMDNSQWIKVPRLMMYSLMSGGLDGIWDLGDFGLMPKT